MLLLKEDEPLKWKYHKLCGDDGNVQVVDVRTAEGENQREIAKICVLPIHQPATQTAGTNSDVSPIAVITLVLRNDLKWNV